MRPIKNLLFRSVCWLLLSLLCLSVSPRAVMAAEDDPFAAGAVSARKLNLRSGPSTADDVTATLKNGDRLNIVSLRGDWLEVETSGGKTGYVLGKYVALDPYPFEALGIGVTTGNVRFRSEPSTRGKRLDTLPRGTSVILLHRESNGWYRIKLKKGGAEGYVSGDYVRLVCAVSDSAETARPDAARAGGFVNRSGVNFRVGPSTHDESLGRLSQDTALSVLSQSGNWYRVQLDKTGKTGYVYRLYVTLTGIPDESETAIAATLTTSGVNLRSGPSTEHKSLGKLKRGTAVTLLAESGRWCQVRVNESGLTGYVYAKYLKRG